MTRPDEFKYDQPTKNQVRQKVLTHAINILTNNRQETYIVQPQELLESISHAKKSHKHIIKDESRLRRLRTAINIEYENWLSLYKTHTQAKKPEELKILYLSGPQPSLDLDVMISQGIRPENVWAIESHRSTFHKALEDIKKKQQPLKLHHGDLSKFLETTPEIFDIIYYDACGPFAQPTTLRPLLQIFLQTKLRPLSVLITNYAEPPTLEKDRYARLAAAFFRSRHKDSPRHIWRAGLDPAEAPYGDNLISATTKDNKLLLSLYSDLITRLTIDLSRAIIPNGRALSSKDVSPYHLTSTEKVKAIIDKANHIPPFTEEMTLQEWYSVLSNVLYTRSAFPRFDFILALREYLKNDPLISMFEELKLGSRSIGSLIAPAELLEQIYNSDTNIASADLLDAINNSWDDFSPPLYCDVPFPNLLINSFLGIYGFPYHTNTRRMIRLRYKAKSNNMYTDVFALDQCRYFYDWMPTVSVAPIRFESFSFQTLARCLIDRLSWHDWGCSSHPFRGGAVPCMKETSSAVPFEPPKRKKIQSH